MIITTIIVLITIVYLIVSFYIAIFHAAPFMPTPMPAVKKLLKHAGIKKGDIVYDLGAGDGRFVHLATKNYGAKATGFELNYFVYLWAIMMQKVAKWQGTMVRANFLKKDLSDADIIICYLLPESLTKYRKKFEKELKKGTKILSYAFSIGGLEPKEVIAKEGKISKINIYEM